MLTNLFKQSSNKQLQITLFVFFGTVPSHLKSQNWTQSENCKIQGDLFLLYCRMLQSKFKNLTDFNGHVFSLMVRRGAHNNFAVLF